ncbi:MAG: hypothetical protein OEM05_07845 [Myxococcales bacterium]|nr:hypothetical protein [Myxococcales bacterium]
MTANGSPLSRAAWVCGALLLACSGCGEGGGRSGSPADSLPPHIRQLTPWGARPDWSHDGRRLLLIDGLVGDVFELELATGSLRPLTQHYENAGYTRALYLANGDVLLAGPRERDPEDPEQGRWTAELWVLDPSRAGPAWPLDQPCFEGPAVSRERMRIAWTLSDYPKRVLFGDSEIWTGEIEYAGGYARLVRRKQLLAASDVSAVAFLEAQSFRPPDDGELLFTAYGYRGGEVMGFQLATGELRNYSRNWTYDEAEGVFPDGRHIAVERNPRNFFLPGRVEIWKLALDESGGYERLTHFTDFEGYGASNPVLSDDGRSMAFQLSVEGGSYGNGRGIFVYDLVAATHAR